MAISKINPNSLGGVPAFSAHPNATLTATNATLTKALFQTEEFDTNGSYDNTTSRFQPLVAGYYLLCAAATFASTAGGSGAYQISLRKNGSVAKIGNTIYPAVPYYPVVTVSALIYLNGSTDYVEAYVSQSTGASKDVYAGSADTYFQGVLMRAA